MPTPVRRAATAAAAALTVGAALLSVPAPARADLPPDPLYLSVVAGTGVAGAPLPAPARQSPLRRPADVAIDPAGNVYVSDSGNCQVEKVTPAGVLTVVAGAGCLESGLPAGEKATEARLGPVTGVAFHDGNLYVADETNAAIFRIDANGDLTTFAGTGVRGVMATGPASASLLDAPMQLSVSGGGLYFADLGSRRAARIDLVTRQLTVLAGAGISYAGANVPAADSALSQPSAVVADRAGNVYIADLGAHLIFKIDVATGRIGRFSEAPAWGLAVAGDTALFSSEPRGFVHRTFLNATSIDDYGVAAGRSPVPSSGPATEGPALATTLAEPFGMEAAPDGTLYVALRRGNQVVKLSTQKPATKPGIPVVTGASAGSGQATLSYAAPVDDGGSAITAYRVRAFLGEEPAAGAECAVPALTCTVTGLTNGKAYTLRVSAGNAVGFGLESPASEAVTPMAPVAPPAPVVYPPGTPAAPVATAGVSSITVTWPAAAGQVSGYVATASPGAGSCRTSPEVRSCVIGAEAGTSTSATVVALGPGGTSPASAASNAVVPTAPPVPATVPAEVPATLTTDSGQLSRVVPDQKITVIGTGFAPHSTAKVVVYSDPVVLGTITTDADGRFALPVTVPKGLSAGAHTFLATGVDPSGAARSMALPVTVPATGPAAVARVVVPKRVVTRGAPGRATMTAPATFTAAVKGRSTVQLWSTVAGKRVELGRGSATMAAAARRAAVPVTLNARGRALAATPGGYPVAVALTTVPAEGRTLRASSRTLLVLSSFTVARPVYFASASSSVGGAQARYLAALRAKLAGVRVVTCTGHTDDRGGRAAAVTLGRQRARQVCRTLTRALNVRTVIVTRGKASPAGSNKTRAGMARNRRADITLTY